MINNYIFWISVSLLASIGLYFVASYADKLLGIVADHFDKLDNKKDR